MHQPSCDVVTSKLKIVEIAIFPFPPYRKNCNLNKTHLFTSNGSTRAGHIGFRSLAGECEGICKLFLNNRVGVHRYKRSFYQSFISNFDNFRVYIFSSMLRWIISHHGSTHRLHIASFYLKRNFQSEAFNYRITSSAKLSIMRSIPNARRAAPFLMRSIPNARRRRSRIRSFRARPSH